MLAGSVAGGSRAAAIHTLIETCEPAISTAVIQWGNRRMPPSGENAARAECLPPSRVEERPGKSGKASQKQFRAS